MNFCWFTLTLYVGSDHPRPFTFRLFLKFYEQLVIGFEAFFFLDPSDPIECEIISIIYKFFELLLLIINQ